MFFLPCKSQELPISYQNALSIIFLKNKPWDFKMVFSILTSIFQSYTVSIPTVINPDLFRKVFLHTISIRSNTKGRRRIRNDLENNYHTKRQKTTCQCWLVDECLGRPGRRFSVPCPSMYFWIVSRHAPPVVEIK